MRIEVPIIKQKHSWSCGAACMASALRYLGVRVREGKVLYKLTGTGLKGTSGAGMMRCAEIYGIESESKKDIKIKELEKWMKEGKIIILSIQSPSEKKDISGWENGHYVILSGIEGGKIYIMDPYYGKEIEIGEKEFIALWHEYSDDGEKEYRSGIIMSGDNLIKL